MSNTSKFMFTFGVITFFVISLIAMNAKTTIEIVGDKITFIGWVFRLISALAASAVSISLPGMLEIRFNKKKDGSMEIIQNQVTKEPEPSSLADKEPTITASGAIAVFVLVYLFNPIQ